MCVFMYISMYVCMFIDVNICKYVCVHALNFTCTQTVCKDTVKLNYNYVSTAGCAQVPQAAQTSGTCARARARHLRLPNKTEKNIAT